MYWINFHVDCSVLVVNFEEEVVMYACWTIVLVKCSILLFMWVVKIAIAQNCRVVFRDFLLIRKRVIFQEITLVEVVFN